MPDAGARRRAGPDGRDSLYSASNRFFSALEQGVILKKSTLAYRIVLIYARFTTTSLPYRE